MLDPNVTSLQSKKELECHVSFGNEPYESRASFLKRAHYRADSQRVVSRRATVDE